jgi:hypothetical protein
LFVGVAIEATGGGERHAGEGDKECDATIHIGFLIIK